MDEMLKDISFCGYYGQRNFGDDVFCVTSDWAAAKYWGTCRTVYIAGELPKMPHPCTKLYPDTQSYRGQYKLRLTAHMLKVKMLVFAGGSVFHGERSWEKRCIYAFQKIRQFRMGAIGVSLGPYRTSEQQRQVIEMLKRLSFLTLRDRQSYREALSYDLPYQARLCFDLAGLLPEVYDGRRSAMPEPWILGVIPCNNAKVPEDVDYAIAEAATKFAERGVRIRLFCLNTGLENDMVRVRRIAERVPEDACQIVSYDGDVERIWKAILECKAICSVRLHGGITACMGRVPFVQIDYHKKCGDFLDTIGWPEELRLPSMAFSWSELADRIEYALGFEGSYPADTASLTELARENFTTI
jgi:polysaccharide pyruvyl transferase WcaK-like protein